LILSIGEEKETTFTKRFDKNSIYEMLMDIQEEKNIDINLILLYIEGHQLRQS